MGSATDRLESVIGLGNPGNKYRNSYHNLGFAAIDTVCEAFRGQLKAQRIGEFYSLRFAPADFAGKPGRYVNRSGEVLAAWVKQFGLAKEKIFVIYDDLALDVGKIRIRPSGSSGGHKGVQSIINNLHTDNFPRLRIGIGPCPNNLPVKEYVLSQIAAADAEIFSRIINKITLILKEISNSRLNSAMNRFNGIDYSE
ncbi:MAG: aminoacyl-tRNA hydrolase [bacterium]